MEALLGPKLSGAGDLVVDTSSICGPGKVVGLYFSAHWCPPCRNFTPKLAEWYKKFKTTEQGKNFEVVFVSSDRDEKAFSEYFAEMPWLALPYKERDIKGKLSKKFKVQGIPTFLIMEGENGKVINKQGRDIVSSDPKGERFPWKSRSFKDIIRDNNALLVNKNGDETTFDAACAGKVKGVYFSAHWCPPCRRFTPELVKTYEAVKAAGKSFEVIFCSGDRDDKSFQEYLNEMPWLALPLDDPREQELSGLFEVQGIPHLVLLDENDELINDDGRAAVSSDPEGKKFPWKPEALEELKEGNGSKINDYPALIVFTDGSDAQVGHVKQALQSHADIEHAKGMANKEMVFFWGAGDPVCESIKKFGGSGVAGNIVLLLLDISSQNKYVITDQPVTELTSEKIGDIIRQFKDGSLAMSSL